ncbi:PREDICTED: shootin-1-like isoform X1 [Cyprinodon variegatus]|uniref:Shootin-1-like n=1 Tax=Cyprinodon variegatus TaxID=28743 RepID=A0A3Q2E683_CYPVA|nr:PREDICTED: shootin-1-like isoform X1 [Cyprinodon variegatus]XP_015230945.1 PREDICTED: shootin-1-like isoform X1 [Cyprinodon variegatus]
MSVQDEDSTLADSDEESCSSSEDWTDIQWEILEKQRDEANQRLTELEEVSNHLLKEMNMLEIQFQVERSCRENAEALALEVTKENKALKRKSQMLMPLISNLPEDLITVTFDPETEPVVEGDVVDCGESKSEDNLLLESQAKITALQESLDGLLAEKLQLELQVEELTREQAQLREQLVVEVEEKEAILRTMSKQAKTMGKIKRVSQLVTEEFTEMSQKLELEQGLRQHAEVFAHQMLVEQKVAQLPSVMEPCSSEGDMHLQLQQALNQIHQIRTSLGSIQQYYQVQEKENKGAEVDNSELQELKEKLKKSEEERKTLESQLSQANASVTELNEEVKRLQETMNKEEKENELKEESNAAPPPPPPPPPLPPPQATPVINLRDFIRSRKQGGSVVDTSKPEPLKDIKAKAVDEMMDRIKKGIILRPVQKIQDEDSSWRDQRSENRKSAILELKGMLDNIKRQHLRRVPSKRGIGRNVGQAELQLVLQRRRKAMGENQDHVSPAQTYDPQPGRQRVPAAGDGPWAGESSSAPVLRRLKQNREKRDSRIRASALIINHGALQHPFEQMQKTPS